MRRLTELGKLAPDPRVDAVKLDPAAPRSARVAVSAGLGDIELLRRLHATEMACEAATSPADKLCYLEGFKELRKAARQRLLQPDPQQAASRSANRGRDPGRGGPSL